LGEERLVGQHIETVRGGQVTGRARALVALGGLLALVSGTVATSVATAAPSDNADDGDLEAGAQDASTGAYEACSANFGYGKVAEVVVKVDGAVPTPPLTYPADVQLLAEFNDGTGIQTCVPDVVTPALWDSESDWALAFGIAPPVGNYVFLPDMGSTLSTSNLSVGALPPGFPAPQADAQAIDPVPVTFRLVGAPAGFTVTVGTAVVDPIELDQVDIDAALQAIMTPAQFAAIDDPEANGCGVMENNPNAALIGARDAMVAALDPDFLAFYNDVSVGDTGCALVDDAYFVFIFQVFYDAEVDRQAIFALTSPAIPASITFTG
jgi:hypothetical protein